MRILHVIHSLDPRSGGPSNSLRGLVQAQSERGHEVHVLATSIQSAEPWDHPQVYETRVLSEACFRASRVQILPAYGRRRPWSRFGFAPACTRQLKRQFHDAARRPDIVHIHGVFSHLTSAAARRAAQSGIPFLLRPAGTLDGSCMTRGAASLKQLFTQILLRRELSLAAALHATSDAEALELKNWAAVDRIVTIPHGMSMPAEGVTAEEFYQSYPMARGRRCILYMGRVHAIKRVELLAQAFALVRQRHPDALLVIAGSDAGGMTQLMEQIRSLCISDQTLLTGFLQSTLKQSAFQAAQVFVLPSAHENYGVAVVEAMASAVPVILTPEVAVHQFVNQSQCGQTVQPTPDAIAGGICQILEGEWRSIGERGADFIRSHLSWAAVVGQLESAYARAIESTGPNAVV